MAEKIKRTAISDFYLVDDDNTEKRKLITAGEEVEMTNRQFDRAVKAQCVHKDEAQDAEAKTSAERKKKAAETAVEQQRKANAPAQVSASATEMRTEAGERTARAADATARDRVGAEARQEAAAPPDGVAGRTHKEKR